MALGPRYLRLARALALLPLEIGACSCGRTGLHVPRPMPASDAAALEDVVDLVTPVDVPVRSDASDAPTFRDAVDRTTPDVADAAPPSDGAFGSCTDQFGSMSVTCPAGWHCTSAGGKGAPVRCIDAGIVDGAIPCGVITCAPNSCSCRDVDASTCACLFAIGALPPPDLPA